MSLAVRISLDEVQVRAICERWTPYCEQIIAYEHPSGVPARTHCHLLLIGCSVTTARLKQLANRIERGNAFWNFKTADTNVAETYKYVTYMSKGIYEPFWIGSEMHVEYKEFEKLKGQWIEPVKPPAKLTMLQRYQEFENLCV